MIRERLQSPHPCAATNAGRTSLGPCFHTRSPATPSGSWLMAMTSRDLSSNSVSRLNALHAYISYVVLTRTQPLRPERAACHGHAAPQVAADDQGALYERPERKVCALLCMAQLLTNRLAHLPVEMGRETA